jgi:chemotaxis protein methyltransferase CheR
MRQTLNKLELDPETFNAIADLAYKESGLQLVVEKSSMIQSRLRHRLNAIGISSFAHYVELVKSDQGREERKNMISALTTNVSHFFRESHHFDTLVTEVFPAALPKLRAGGRFRIWSAGSSNGQEAFSILISLAEAFPDLDKYDVKVLATDIDSEVVAFSKNARYPERFVAGVPAGFLKKYFHKSDDASGAIYTVNSNLRNKVFFNELNLLAPWPIKSQMDAIFCRNVVIYFDQETQNTLWQRFKKQLHKGGYLFLGHSERISDPAEFGFYSDGPTTYRPVNPADAGNS